VSRIQLQHYYLCFYSEPKWILLCPSLVALLLLQQFTLILLLQQLLCKAMQKLTGMPYSKGTLSLPKRELTKIIYACDKKGKARFISSKLKDLTIHKKKQRPGSRSKKCSIVIIMAHEVDRCTPESLNQQVRLAGRQVEIARPIYFYGPYMDPKTGSFIICLQLATLVLFK
jgi:hypothetical protein